MLEVERDIDEMIYRDNFVLSSGDESDDALEDRRRPDRHEAGPSVAAPPLPPLPPPPSLVTDSVAPSPLPISPLKKPSAVSKALSPIVRRSQTTKQFLDDSKKAEQLGLGV